MEVVVNLHYLDTRSFRVVSGILRAVVYTSRATLLTWEKLPTGLAPTDLIYLQKSGTNEATGWVTIKIAKVSDVPNFLDNSANNTLHRHGFEWYRLVLPSLKKIVGPVSVQGTADLVGSEIAYRHKVILENTPAGNACYAFVRMRDGIRCPNCWDELLQQRSRTGCTSCYDTGFMPGFYDPIAVALNFGPEQSTAETSMEGPSNTSAMIEAWTANYPLLSNGDVIIEPTSHAVWTIMKVGMTTVRRIVTKQELSLQRAQGDDAIMRLVFRLPGGDEAWHSLLQN